MICPLCATRVAIDEEACPRCGVALKEYAMLAYLPDRLINDALAELEAGRWAQATERFAQASLFRPRDVDALRGWAHALVQLGQLEEALDKIDQALAVGGPAVQDEYDEIVGLFVAAQAPVPSRVRRRRARLTLRPRL